MHQSKKKPIEKERKRQKKRQQQQMSQYQLCGPYDVLAHREVHLYIWKRKKNHSQKTNIEHHVIHGE